MKFIYICALLLPIIVSAYPSRDDTVLSILKNKFRLNKIDDNVNEEVVNADANVDLVPDESIAADGIDQMPAEFQNLGFDLKSMLSDIIGNILKAQLQEEAKLHEAAKIHEVPDMSVASDGFDNNNDLKPDMSVVSDSEDNLVPDMEIATDDLADSDIKPDIFVFPDAENNFVPEKSIDSNIFYKNLKIKGLLNKINY